MLKEYLSQELEFLCSIPVSKEDLMRLNAAILEHRRQHPQDPWGWRQGDPGFEDLGRDIHHFMAMTLRLLALIGFMKDREEPGWMQPRAETHEGRLINDALLAAAAVAPVIVREDGSGWTFERQSFLDRALELADTEGHA